MRIGVGLVVLICSSAPAEVSQKPRGAVEVPGFELPCSSLASKEACDSIAADQEKRTGPTQTTIDLGAATVSIVEKRSRADESMILPVLRKQEARWAHAVRITPEMIAGVYTEVFEPEQGVAPRNRNRVLINLHSGGFMVGGPTAGRVESLPISGLGRIKVISIDYRMAPEYRFPAASEDVAAVYTELLKRYDPKNIGIYGCSAGGILTAQSVAWFLHKGLPVPGAIGMFSGTGQSIEQGDSVYLPLDQPLQIGNQPLSSWLYFKGMREDDPLISPVRTPSILKKFPPSLLITGSRAYDLSSIVDAANRLTLAGVPTQLNVWDGVGHCFLSNPDLPESREAERVIVDFFDRRLKP
jgi:acetyl esterase/lipase